MGRTAIVIQHEPEEGLAQLEPLLRDAGFSLQHRLRRLEARDALAPLVIVLGGPMGVYEADAHPYLHAEQQLLRQRLADAGPTLGICLGAQLLAAAAGATVYPGSAGFELGAHPVAMTQHAKSDPVFGACPEELWVPQWHADTFDALPNATLLATSRRYPQQAFRLGNSYGLQFHAELDEEDLRRWIAQLPEDVARSGCTGGDLEAGLAHLRENGPALADLRARLVARLAACA